MQQKQIIAALGIIINDEGQFLITLRNDPDNPRAHHKWEIPGGGVEDGETIEQAVVREVKEEIGVVIELLPFPSISVPVAIQDPHNLERKKLTLVGFIARIIAGEIKLDFTETIDYRWVTIEEIKQLDYLSKTDIMFEKASRMLKKDVVPTSSRLKIARQSEAYY